MDTPQTTLQNVFRFTDGDLKDNRQGRLSDAQVSRIRRSAAKTPLVIIGILAVLGVLAVMSAQPSPSELPIFLIFLIIPAVVTLALTVGVTEAAIAPRVVSKRSGQIHLAEAPFGFNPPLTDEETLNAFVPHRSPLPIGNGKRVKRPVGMYSLLIDDQLFRLSPDEYHALTPSVYTIYFVPTIQKIVALEPVAVPTRTIDVAASLPAPALLDDDDRDTLRG
ncbi:MAG: hypothetical protein IT324_02465 [Anaerolineae bacterium]|nr:hypothetical protein [Anaerolineae bacterium]